MKKQIKNRKQDCINKDITIRQIYNDIIDGYQVSVIIKKLMDGEYESKTKYTEGSAKNLVTEAKKMLREDFEADKPQLKADLYARYMDLYSDAKDAGDRMNARLTLDSVVKLTGAAEPEKIDVNGNMEIIVKFKNKKDSE